MAVHIISYDLNKIKNYERLKEFIEGISGNWCRPVASTWYVHSNYSTVQIMSHLSNAIDKDDVLIVSEVTGPTVWSPSLSAPVAKWLLDALGP